MPPRVAGALCLALLVSGCAIGPDRPISSRMAYNDSVQITEQRELLLNIVQLRYLETPELLAIHGISAQFELNSSIMLVGEFDGDGDLALVQPQAQLGFAERPTITFIPHSKGPSSRVSLSPPSGRKRSII